MDDFMKSLCDAIANNDIFAVYEAINNANVDELRYASDKFSDVSKIINHSILCNK